MYKSKKKNSQNIKIKKNSHVFKKNKLQLASLALFWQFSIKSLKYSLGQSSFLKKVPLLLIAHRKMHSYLEANGSEHVDLFIITNASKLYNIGEKCIISPAALSNSYSVASVLAFRHANSDENFRLQKTREKEVEADGKLLWIFFTFFRFGSKINEVKSEE